MKDWREEITPENVDKIPSCNIWSNMTQAQIDEVNAVLSEFNVQQSLRRVGRIVHVVFGVLFAGVMAFNAWLVYLIWG